MQCLKSVLFCLCTCLILQLGCSSQSDDDESTGAASCLLDDTAKKSCWNFTGKSQSEIELIRTKCEDGTGFGSQGTFTNGECQITASIGSCFVVLEDLGEGTLYFFSQWSQEESSDICAEVLSGTYTDANDMSIARTWD